MEKNVTILTYDEMDEIRETINSLISDAHVGAYEYCNPKDMCLLIHRGLRDLKDLFDF